MAKVITKKEYRRRRIRFQVAAGLFDFLVTIASFFLIVFCGYLLVSLYQWLAEDIPITFKVFFDIAERALTMH